MSQRGSTIESGISNHYHQALLLSPGRSRSALCSPGSLFILMIMPASHKQVHTDYSQKPQEEARAAFTRQKAFCGAPSPRLFFPFPRSRCAIEALALPHFWANEDVMAGSGDSQNRHQQRQSSLWPRTVNTCAISNWEP